MVVWLTWEATNRVFFLNEIEIDAPIMLVTAFVSLGCNIFSLIVLGHVNIGCFKKKAGEAGVLDNVTSVYKPHGGHDCGHDHGDDEAGHDHGHDHGGHDHGGHDHGGHDHGGHDHSAHADGGNLNINAAVAHVIGDLL